MQKTVDIFSIANNTHVMCNIEKNEDHLSDNVDFTERESISFLVNDNYKEIQRRRTEQRAIVAKMIEELKKKYPEGTQKPDYPLGKEKAMLTIFRRGEFENAMKILHELTALIVFLDVQHSDGEARNFYAKLRFTELLVLLSRVEINPIKNKFFLMDANDKCLKMVQEAATINELIDILNDMADRVIGFITAFRGSPHAAALRKAESFIAGNFTRKLSLKEIAAVAGLSPPYFSTIFKDETGENLSKYLNRLRVEKACKLLLETEMSLSEIAASCCFEDQSWFSKIFKAFTGISPGKFRNQGGGIISDIGEATYSGYSKKRYYKG